MVASTIERAAVDFLNGLSVSTPRPPPPGEFLLFVPDEATLEDRTCWKITQGIGFADNLPARRFDGVPGCVLYDDLAQRPKIAHYTARALWDYLESRLPATHERADDSGRQPDWVDFVAGSGARAWCTPQRDLIYATLALLSMPEVHRMMDLAVCMFVARAEWTEAWEQQARHSEILGCLKKKVSPEALLDGAHMYLACRGGDMSASSLFTGFLLAVLTVDVSHGATDPPTRLSVRAVGDFDADGRSDIVMSADPNDIIQIHRGLAGGTFEPGAWAQLRPEPCYATDKFGHSVAVGDFDGDGFDDLAVGAPNADEMRGRVYLYRGGSAGLDNGPAAILTGSDLSSRARFGMFLGAGSVRGDDMDDLVVLATHLRAEGDPPSQLFLYGGGSDGLQLVREQTIIAGAFEMPTLLSSLVASCDVDGDSFDDVVIQAGHQFSAEQARLHPLWGGPAGLEVSAHDRHS